MKFNKPKEGILGTNPSKSALLNLISNNNKFPDIYFWETEKVNQDFIIIFLELRKLNIKIAKVRI